jgi:NAD-dependent deacetylase
MLPCSSHEHGGRYSDAVLPAPTIDIAMIPDPLRQHLRSCQNIVVFTGAGMSAESGIPTFRDRFEGLWAHYDPQEVATPQAFRANPQLVWDWHVYLAEKIRQATPNAGHEAVARLGGRVPNLTVITQNIDNLHQLAGSPNVLELHGNLFRLKAFVDSDDLFAGDHSPIICHLCDGYAVAEECDPYAGPEDLAAIALKAGSVPRCPGCGALLRPDIVWFGEPLDINVLEGAMRAADTCDALICIGSSLEVQPAASIPVRAKWNGATIIEINPEATALSYQADVFLRGKAAEVLPQLVQSVWESVLTP